MLSINQTNPKLGISNKRDYYKKFSRFVCFAVEDVTEKKRELGGDGVAGVVENTPGKWNPTQIFYVCVSVSIVNCCLLGWILDGFVDFITWVFCLDRFSDMGWILLVLYVLGIYLLSFFCVFMILWRPCNRFHVVSLFSELVYSLCYSLDALVLFYQLLMGYLIMYRYGCPNTFHVLIHLKLLKFLVLFRTLVKDLDFNLIDNHYK